jgi:hypothetical protein
MALVLADRVRETTTTVGTGTVTLAGAVTGFQSFAVVGDGNTTYYTIAGQGTSEWEVGIGTYTSSGTTLARTAVLASSNSGSLVSFSAGTKDVFVTYPADKSVNQDANGNVGIGTSSPDANLTVNGAASFAAGTALLPSIARAGDLNTGIFFPAADTIAFSEGGVEAMRIDSAGNVGIGVTPSAWGTFKAIQINGMSLAATSLNSQFLTNAYFDGTNYRYLTNAGAISYYQDQNTGHAWSRAGAGTAGNTIAFTQAMTLDTSGRLLLGTTASQTLSTAGVVGNLQIETANGSANATMVRNTANSTGPIFAFGKSRGAALGSRTVVVSGDILGEVRFDGADGTNMLDAASIIAQVDGTPGTNDMPGRLVFSTTADGASSPTERLRITAAGAINMAATSSLQKGGVNTYTLKGITYLTSGTGATYDTPDYVRAIYVECVGGGGGGGGVDGQGAGTGVGGGGGAGGGYVAKLITSPSNSYTYTIGAGGTGGAAGANGGAVGGDTTFTDGTITLTATSGNGGNGLTASASNAYYNQSTGGDGTGGDVGIGGQRGGARSRGNFAQYYGGYGGGSVFGQGGGGNAGTNSSGGNGTNYGGGGGGGANDGTTSNYAGGNGFQGVIRITEYY